MGFAAEAALLRCEPPGRLPPRCRAWASSKLPRAGSSRSSMSKRCVAATHSSPRLASLETCKLLLASIGLLRASLLQPAGAGDTRTPAWAEEALVRPPASAATVGGTQRNASSPFQILVSGFWFLWLGLGVVC